MFPRTSRCTTALFLFPRTSRCTTEGLTVRITCYSMVLESRTVTITCYSLVLESKTVTIKHVYMCEWIGVARRQPPLYLMVGGKPSSNQSQPTKHNRSTDRERSNNIYMYASAWRGANSRNYNSWWAAQSGQTSPVHKNTKAMQQAATSQAHNRPTGANLQATSRIQPSTTDRPTDRSPAQKGKAFKQSVATNAQLTDQPKPSG